MKRILVFFLIITGLYIVFNQSNQFSIFSSNSSNQNRQTSISHDTSQINVDVSSGNTTIIPENRDDIKVVYAGKQRLTVSNHGSSVNISLKGNGNNLFNWSPFSTKKQLKIFVPQDYHKNMSINLGSGNLNMSGQSRNKSMNFDELAIEIGSGNMNLSNLEVNHFKHNGASGNVDINSLVTNTGSFDLSSGNLDIKHYTGAINTEMASGKLDIQLDKLTDSIKIHVISGIVDLDLPDHANFTLNGDMSSGLISCDFPLNSNESSNKKIKGSYGSGKFKINLGVTSGKINIY